MTKRFEYTDIDGIKKEAEAYISSDFTFLSSPNSPVITGPSGTLHPSVIPAVTQAKATSLVITRIASENILRGDALTATTSNHVGLADNELGLSDASVLGVALEDASVGEEVEILILGIMSDVLFSGFAVNALLFLDSSGGITDEKPSTLPKKYLTIIGKSLGGTEILVNVSTPSALGV